MQSIRRLRRWLSDKATECFVRIYHSSYNGPDQFKLSDGESIRIHWFSAEKPLLGQNVPFINSIILNREYLDDVSKDAMRRVVRHEISHQRRNSIFRGFWLGVSFLAIFGLFLLVDLIPLVVQGVSLTALAPLIVIGAVPIVAFVLLNRVEETLADLHVVMSMGEERFLRACEETASLGEGTRVSKFMKTVMYTEPAHTVAIYRRLSGLGIVD